MDIYKTEMIVGTSTINAHAYFHPLNKGFHPHAQELGGEGNGLEGPLFKGPGGSQMSKRISTENVKVPEKSN